MHRPTYGGWECREGKKRKRKATIQEKLRENNSRSGRDDKRERE